MFPVYCFVLKYFWWFKPAFAWAFGKLFDLLESGDELCIGYVPLQMQMSRSVRYTETLLQILCLVPPEVANRSVELDDAFPRSVFPREEVSECIRLCREMLRYCFSLRWVDYEFMFHRPPREGSEREETE